MNRSVIGLTVPVLMVASCTASPSPQPVSNGAKPITLVSPTPAPQTITTEAPTPIPDSGSASTQPVHPDSMPRETDFNSADVAFVSESVVRSQRMVKAAKNYLRGRDISPAGQEVAKRLSAKHSATLTSQKELLKVWGVSNPEAIYPAHPAGIATEAEIDQLGAMYGPELDQRFLELAMANLEGFAESARRIAKAGFNPEVREEAELVLEELEKEKASYSEAMH